MTDTRGALRVGGLVPADLDERLTREEEVARSRPRFEHKAFQVSVGHVPESKPEHVWRRVAPVEQRREVSVLRDDDHIAHA